MKDKNDEVDRFRTRVNKLSMKLHNATGQAQTACKVIKFSTKK